MASKSTRPTVIVNCVSDRWASPGERIVEVVFPSGRGMLINFREINGHAVMQPYRIDKDIAILVPPEEGK